MPELRYDRGTLRKPRLKANGFKEYDALATRTGVFVYRNVDGSERREYRPPNEVFRADTLQSLANVPVTDDHPPRMVGPENASLYTRGAVSPNVSQEDSFVAVSFTVFDAALQRKMDSGKTAISLGYRCDVIYTPGITPEGEHYDAIQTGIVYNHLAVVDAARGGEHLKVRMDDDERNDEKSAAQSNKAWLGSRWKSLDATPQATPTRRADTIEFRPEPRTKPAQRSDAEHNASEAHRIYLANRWRSLE